MSNQNFPFSAAFFIALSIFSNIQFGNSLELVGVNNIVINSIPDEANKDEDETEEESQNIETKRALSLSDKALFYERFKLQLVNWEKEFPLIFTLLDCYK